MKRRAPTGHQIRSRTAASPAPQRAAIFRLSRRQPGGPEHQPPRREGLLHRGEGRTLPGDGGVFYLRGGYNNNDGLVPLDPTPGDPARLHRQRRPPRLFGSADLRGLRGRRRSTTSPTAPTGRRARSSSPMTRPTASTTMSPRRSATPSPTARSWRRPAHSRRS